MSNNKSCFVDVVVEETFFGWLSLSEGDILISYGLVELIYAITSWVLAMRNSFPCNEHSLISSFVYSLCFVVPELLFSPLILNEQVYPISIFFPV